jgi:hypothetical protein
MSSWSSEQSELQRLVVLDESYEPMVAGKFRDRRPQPHEWLRVLAAGHHPLTGERYLLLQIGGSGGGWWKASEIELFPDEPEP